MTDKKEATIEDEAASCPPKPPVTQEPVKPKAKKVKSISEDRNAFNDQSDNGVS